MTTNISLTQIIDKLELIVLTGNQDFDHVFPTSGYVSDLLSCVMAGAKKHSVWITLQAHANVVAVAALLELDAVIISEGAQIDPASIEKAREEGIVLLSTTLPTYQIAGRLFEMGLGRNSTED